MDSSYRRNLISTVLEASRSSFWDSAVQEWVVDDCEEDNTLSSACICGKEKLRYLYTIFNRETGTTLYPIGSCCIKKFEREDMNEEISVTEDMFRLLHAIRDREYIRLTSDFFSRKLLRKLYDEGAFIPNQYNRLCFPNINYMFLLKLYSIFYKVL